MGRNETKTITKGASGVPRKVCYSECGTILKTVLNGHNHSTEKKLDSKKNLGAKVRRSCSVEDSREPGKAGIRLADAETQDRRDERLQPIPGGGPGPRSAGFRSEPGRNSREKAWGLLAG